MAKNKKKKIKIPKSVFELRWSEKKFAKENNIRIKGKGMGKKAKKEAQKHLMKEYSRASIKNLDKVVKILSENPIDNKKIMKLRAAVDNVLFNPDLMESIAKLYKKDPKEYPNLIYFPYMITSTIFYYNQEGISDEEKEYADRLDKEALLKFCTKILKKQIKYYSDAGLSDAVAFELACVMPTTKLLSVPSVGRQWYKRLIQKLYDMAEVSEIDLPAILSAVRTVDKNKKYRVSKAEFNEGFFSEVIMRKATNKVHAYTDGQKELQENLIEATLMYMDSLKSKKLRSILRTYIKRRKTAEEHKNDTKRIIKFIDHANSNSAYGQVKSVVQDLIADNGANELYLS